MPVKILKRTFSLFSIFLLTAISLKAQRGTVSPYSRYGVGELPFNGFVTQVGMGGLSNAWYAPDLLNFLNPATYSFDTITTFEAGVKGEMVGLSSDSSSQTANGTSLSYLAFGFPVVKNKLGASLGMIPYSSVGYNITSEENDAQLGRVDSKFTGDGGLTKFYLGMGYAPFSGLANHFYTSGKYKRLAAEHDTVRIRKIENRFKKIKGFSIGFNAAWLFGTLSHTKSIEFKDVANIYDTRLISTTTLGDVYFNYGLFYTCTSKKGFLFNAGLTTGLNSEINSKLNSLWYNYTSNGLYETIKDTVGLLIVDQKGTTTIPLYYSGGIAVGKKGKWIAGIDFSAQQWSKYQSYGISNNLQDSYNIALGGELIPNKKGLKYTQKINYRFGLHYAKTFLQLNNTDINDYGFSFGFGLPVINKDRIQKAILQLGFEAGQKGTTKNDLLKMQYFRFHLGITLNETWFFKRKYD